MRFLIPSYNRLERCTTVQYLHEVGVPKGEIYIATQTSQDYDGYSKKYGGIANVIYREAHNCAGQRNTLVGLMDYGETALFLDDDLRSIQKYVMPSSGGYGKPVNMDMSMLTDMCNEAEEFIDEGVTDIVGTAWNDNRQNLFRMMSSGKRLKKPSLLSGATMFVKKDEDLRFDETLDCLDDTELCLRYISEGRQTMMVVDWVMRKPKDTTEKGGCYDVYQSGKKTSVLKELDRRYYPMARHKKDWTGMRLAIGLR